MGEHTNEYARAFIKALEKAKKKSAPKADGSSNLTIPTFKQEVVIGVPNQFIQEDKNGAPEFIRKAGAINRNPLFTLPIKLETQEFTTVEGKRDIMINIIAIYSQETDIPSVAKFLGVG